MSRIDLDRTRASWWAVGAVLFAAVLFVLYSFVGTFVFGLFLYYATRPLYGEIEDRLPDAIKLGVPGAVRRRVPGGVARRVPHRSLAAALSLLLLALPVMVLLAYTVAISLQEFRKVSRRISLDPYLSIAQPYFDVSNPVTDPESLVTTTGGLDAIQRSLTTAIDYLGFVGNGLLHLFVMFALAFYLLRDDHRLAAWTRSFTDGDGVVETFLEAVDRSFHNVFFGNILNAIMTGAIGALCFSVLDAFAPASLSIPYPALVGLLAGVASLVPVVGMKLVYVPVTGYLAAVAATVGTGWWFVGAFVAVSFVVVDTIPDLVLRPYVSGRNIHTGSLMFAYIFGPLLFGWYGLFLGPLILVVVVHFSRIIVPELLHGVPIEPRAIDVTGEETKSAEESVTGRESDRSRGEAGESGPASS
ncbi:AI-2E family transporter [Halobacteriales archaeon QS_1_68_17]|nr:MAG: AI-2E family transporter [Halobacteriales archaeon QS_1_68_17]